jgi:hypothetical protein
MSQTIINNTDTNPDNIQQAGTIINDNFTDLYTNKLSVYSGFDALESAPTQSGDFLGWHNPTSSWLPSDSTTVRENLLNTYAQPLDSGLTQLSALVPSVDGAVSYESNTWVAKTAEQLRWALATPQTKCIEMFEDFTYVYHSTNFVGGTYRWIGNNLDFPGFTPTGGYYGAFGIGITIFTTKTAIMMLDASQDNTVFSAAGSPGLYFTLPNILTKFRVARVRAPFAGSSFFYGYFNTNAPATAYGVYFTVSDSNNLQCVTKDAAGTTSTDSGVAMPDNAFITLGITSNATGDSISFYVNDVLKATHTTNIFTDSLRFGICNNYSGSNGVTGQTTIDYWYLYIPGLNRI